MVSTKTFDFIIIGAGSAGCVLANRLSADPSNKVLLLEAGGRDLNPLFRLPMLMGKLFHSGIYNWHYHTEPERHLNGRSLYWPRGKVLGGTSTINGMIYVRGNRHDYDRWAQIGAAGWSYDEVLPAFLRSESHVQRNGAYHNSEGELTVCRARGWNSLLDVFNEAGGQAGYPHNDDFNGGEQEGFGRYDFTIAKGKRCSAAYAFLRPARKRSNLTIISRAHARRILIENGRAIGVEFTRKGNISQVYADREVILSAGVVNSPQILMLSGIGAADELAQHNISVVQDLPGVGKNLQDHVDCVMSYECREPVTLYSDLRADKLTWSVIQGMLLEKESRRPFHMKPVLSSNRAKTWLHPISSFTSCRHLKKPRTCIFQIRSRKSGWRPIMAFHCALVRSIQRAVARSGCARPIRWTGHASQRTICKQNLIFER